MKTLPALFLLLALAGCVYQTVSSYTPYPETIFAVQHAVSIPVNIGPFQDASFRKELTCRSLAIITAPNDQSYADAVRQALIDELAQANRYDPNSPVTLTALLNRIDVETETGSWIIRLTLFSSNGKHMVLETSHAYDSMAFGEAACIQATYHYLPALRQFIANLLASPEFAELTQNTLPPNKETPSASRILNTEEKAAAIAKAREIGKERIRQANSLENPRQTATGNP